MFDDSSLIKSFRIRIRRWGRADADGCLFGMMTVVVLGKVTGKWFQKILFLVVRNRSLLLVNFGHWVSVSQNIIACIQ